MEKVFGLELSLIFLVVTSLSIGATLAILILGITNKVLVKMGVRNIPRRPAQSALIVLGLMLSTTIIGASLGIGDTISHSIRKVALDSLGMVDETITARSANPYEPSAIDSETIDLVRSLAADNPDIDGVIARIETVAPTLNMTNDRTEARLIYRGYEVDQQPEFGTLVDLNGQNRQLSDLGVNQVFLNEDAAKRLGASAGDNMQMFSSAGMQPISVHSVLQPGGLASGGNNPVALLSLRQLGVLIDRQGEADTIGISNKGGIEDGLGLSDSVTGFLRVSLTNRQVADEMVSLLSREEPISILKDKVTETGLNETVAEDLIYLIQELEGNNRATDEAIRLIGDSDIYGLVAQALAQVENGNLVVELDVKRRGLSDLIVDDSKKDAIELAQTVGGFVTSIFTIFGSFSVVVGLLLIFLVMVLLAAARSAEMGMSRAIGLRRLHLIQIFTYEGWAYALGSAVIGTAVGILASLVLVSLLQRAIGVDEFAIYPKMTMRSIAITVSTGFLLTLITVVASAYRVSQLNIISAIRGVGEELASSPPVGWKYRSFIILLAMLGPIGVLIQGRRSQSRMRLLTLTLLVALPPVWIARFLWKTVANLSPLVTQGWLLILLGTYLTWYGLDIDQRTSFDFGVTLLILGTSLSLRTVLFRVVPGQDTSGRISASLGALGLLVYFGLPFDALEGITGKLSDGPADFVLGGCVMVAAASWLIMHNAEIFLFIMNKTLGRVAGLTAVFRTAVAYPVNSRFRTGLTISMFALVIFTLVINATLSNLDNVSRDTPERVTGGYDIQATVTDSSAIIDFDDEVAASALLKVDDIVTVARSGGFRSRLRQVEATNTRFKGIRTIVVDDAYLESNRFELSHYDASYGTTDAQVWQSLSDSTNLVLLSNRAIATEDPFGPPSSGFRVEGFSASDEAESWESVSLEVVLPSWDGQDTPLVMEAVGVVDPLAGIGGGDDWGGQSLFMVIGESTAQNLVGQIPEWNTYYLDVNTRADVPDVVAKLETIFLQFGMDATDLQEQIEMSLQQEAAFNQLFQGFMGLGLFVGVCAIGVLAIRAVVERRQSIGVLRAIGYRPAMIQLQFLLESLFVTLLGVVIGLGLGTLTSWNIFKAITTEVDGLTFTIPWASIIFITFLTSLFALVSGYWPARQASKIRPAEALRYE